jgi:hypothetical protein
VGFIHWVEGNHEEERNSTFYGIENLEHTIANLKYQATTILLNISDQTYALPTANLVTVFQWVKGV